MAYFDTTWYTHYGDGITTGHFALTKWAATASIAPGTLRRQLTVTPGNERVFVATQAATQTTGSVEPTWVITRGGRSAIDGAVQWQECTGAAGLNGDLTNSQIWVQNAAISIGATIKNIAGTFLFIASVAGTSKNTAGEPAWSTATGATTVDGSVTWTCIGPVGNFPAWSAPHARLTNAITSTWGVAGNDFYVADNSQEASSAVVTLNLGSTTSPCRYFSIDHNAAMPPTASSLKAGASITGSNAAANAIGIGNISNTQNYWFGFSFIVSGNAAAVLFSTGGGGNIRVRFEQCAFINSSANAGASMAFSSAVGSSAVYDYINCAFTFGNSGHFLTVAGGTQVFRGPSSGFLNGTAAATLFRAGSAASVLLDGVDLTPLGAGALFLNTSIRGNWTIKNCQLNASSSLYLLPMSNIQDFNLDLINTDSGAGILRNERHNGLGDETTITTVYRTGGASEGGVGISHLIIPTTFSRAYHPFNALPLVIWNDLIGSSRTLTVYGCCDVLTTIPNNLAIWMDVEYMGSASTPLGSFVSTGLVTVLDAPTTYSSDSSTWTGSIQSGSRFKMSVTFTPQQKGNVYVYPRAASTTRVILDPLPVIT